jgi:opacity protein-like surface antigen
VINLDAFQCTWGSCSESSLTKVVLRFSTILSISLLWANSLVAQDQSRSAPIPAAKGPEYDIAFGYSYVALNVSGKPAGNLSGADVSATIDFHPRWGTTFDSSYVRAGRDRGSGHSSYVLSLLAGPVFVPAQNDNTRLLVRALAGVGLVDGSVPVNQLYYRGWQSRFSWGVGTGIERNISTPLAVRFNVDYLRTRFVSSTGTLEPQNDIRLIGSLVFRSAARRPKRRLAARQP